MRLNKEERTTLKYAVITFLAMIALYLIASALLETSRFLVTVTSDSMLPALSRGDIVAIKNADDIKIGDIIVFKTRDDLHIHRVIGMDGEYYITKGDAYSYPDAGRIDRQRILGKVVAKIPYLGYVGLFLKGKL